MMTNQVSTIPPIPRETARSAKAVFGHNNFYILVGENLGEILEDIHLESFSEAGRGWWAGGATTPLITFFQYVEGLTDAQAADAVRTRVEWKFALHLSLYAPIFKEHTLCEFRQMSITDPTSQLEFQKLIDRLLALRPSIDHKIERLENSELLSAVCLSNQMNWAWMAMCQALEALASKYPDWLRQAALPHWYGRYNHLSAASASSYQRGLSMDEIGEDIHHLIVELMSPGNQEMNDLQEVRSLYRIWIQLFKKWNDSQSNLHTNLISKDCESCINKAG